MKNFLTSLFKPKSPKPIGADEKIFELVENLYLKHKRNPNISSSVADITITSGAGINTDKRSFYAVKIRPLNEDGVSFIFAVSRSVNSSYSYTIYSVSDFSISSGKSIVPLRHSEKERVYDIVLAILEKTVEEKEQELDEAYSSIDIKLKALEETL